MKEPRIRSEPLFKPKEDDFKAMYEDNLTLYISMVKEYDFAPTSVLKNRIRSLSLRQQKIDKELSRIWQNKYEGRRV